MRFAYVSGITNDSFVKGMLIMFSSLNQHCKATGIDRICFVTENVTKETRRLIEKRGILCIEVPYIKGTDSGRWKTTFQKLAIFSFIQYDKLVWVDADMIVMASLDSLFNRPHMSAVRTRMPTATTGVYSFNSGLMVIAPNVFEYEGIVSTVDSVINQFSSLHINPGDQNVLNEYYKLWPMAEENQLEDGYNVFFGSIESYIDNGYSAFNDNKKRIYIVHFTGPHKPWEKRFWFTIKAWIRAIRYQHHIPNAETRKILSRYYSIMREVENEQRKSQT